MWQQIFLILRVVTFEIYPNPKLMDKKGLGPFLHCPVPINIHINHMRFIRDGGSGSRVAIPKIACSNCFLTLEKRKRQQQQKDQQPPER